MVIGTEHGRYGLSCMQKLCSAQAILGLYVMLECKLCCEILLLLNVADTLYVEGCGVSSGECIVYLVGVNRLVHVESLWCA